VALTNYQQQQQQQLLHQHLLQQHPLKKQIPMRRPHHNLAPLLSLPLLLLWLQQRCPQLALALPCLLPPLSLQP
jgi:hypothetical protein